MFGFPSCFGTLGHFFIPTSFTLPDGKHGSRISGILVNRAIRGNDFATTLGTGAPAGRANIDIEREWIVAGHSYRPSSRSCCSPAPLCRFKMIKIEQKIATGGVNKTSTPMLKFRMKNALLEPARDARHIAHCAKPVPSSRRSNSNAGTRTKTNLVMGLNFINALPQPAMAPSL